MGNLDNNAFGGATGHVAVAGGATLASSNTRHFANASTFADGATLTNLLASGTWTGNATLTSGTTTVTGVSASTPITMSGVISGAGGITKTGANTLTLSNTNTRTGDLQKECCTHNRGVGRASSDRPKSRARAFRNRLRRVARAGPHHPHPLSRPGGRSAEAARSLQGLRAVLQTAWTHCDRSISALERLVAPPVWSATHGSRATGTRRSSGQRPKNHRGQGLPTVPLPVDPFRG